MVALLCAGCSTQHRITVDPVEFKPIHLTMEVNVKIQRELDDFFDFEEKLAPGPGTATDGTPSNGDRE